jgi:hypothetical protein
MDIRIENLAPDADVVLLHVGDEWQINVERDAQGTVRIVVEDLKNGSETRLVLGQEGETQKL